VAKVPGTDGSSPYRAEAEIIQSYSPGVAHLMHGSFSPHESASQVVSHSVQPFLQGFWLWQPYSHADHTTLVGN